MDAALIYQHRTADRDRAIADAIDLMLTRFDELPETSVAAGAGESSSDMGTGGHERRFLMPTGAVSKGRWRPIALSCNVFACGAGDGNRTRTVSLGRVLILPCFRVLQRYWRPQLASGDPYRPGLVARVWPGSLGSRVENRALAQSSLAEDHRDLTECLTTEDVRRPLSPFDARVPVITAAYG
jgi:hypothetical protein